MRQSFIIGAALVAVSLISAPVGAMPVTQAPSTASVDVVLTGSGGVSGSAKRRYYKKESYHRDYRGDKHHAKRGDYGKKTTGRTVYKGFGPKQGDYRFSYTGRVGGVVPRSSAPKPPVVRHTRPRIIQLR